MRRITLCLLLLMVCIFAGAQDLEFEVNKITFKMIRVEGGSFKMGATKEQLSEANADEYPVQKVTLETYYIGETEVTQELWTAVMGKNPSFFIGNEKRPVENVSWGDCQQFIEKLNAMLHKNKQLAPNLHFALPTEAQWEYAARGGRQSKGCKYSGSSAVGSVSWFYYSKGVTHMVGKKLANELGIYDMSGNVFEWCADWYHPHEFAEGEVPMDTARVLRGGSWSSPSKNCRVSNRFCQTPEKRAGNFGLRLALIEQ